MSDTFHALIGLKKIYVICSSIEYQSNENSAIGMTLCQDSTISALVSHDRKHEIKGTSPLELNNAVI